MSHGVATTPANGRPDWSYRAYDSHAGYENSRRVNSYPRPSGYGPPPPLPPPPPQQHPGMIRSGPPPPPDYWYDGHSPWQRRIPDAGHPPPPPPSHFHQRYETRANAGAQHHTPSGGASFRPPPYLPSNADLRKSGSSNNHISGRDAAPATVIGASPIPPRRAAAVDANKRDYSSKRKSEEGSNSDDPAAKKKGDPLSLLAKVSSAAMAVAPGKESPPDQHDNNNNSSLQTMITDEEPHDDDAQETVVSPPRRSRPSPITPLLQTPMHHKGVTSVTRQITPVDPRYSQRQHPPRGEDKEGGPMYPPNAHPHRPPASAWATPPHPQYHEFAPPHYPYGPSSYHPPHPQHSHYHHHHHHPAQHGESWPMDGPPALVERGSFEEGSSTKSTGSSSAGGTHQTPMDHSASSSMPYFPPRYGPPPPSRSPHPHHNHHHQDEYLPPPPNRHPHHMPGPPWATPEAPAPSPYLHPRWSESVPPPMPHPRGYGGEAPYGEETGYSRPHPPHHHHHPTGHPHGPPYPPPPPRVPHLTDDSSPPHRPDHGRSADHTVAYPGPSPYTYVQQPRQEERTMLRKKFSWKHYPELERFLIANRDEYLRHSSMNYTAEQKQYNNWLTERLLEVSQEYNYVFDPEEFNFVAIRDRIRCYYKSFVQTARKRGLMTGGKKAPFAESADRVEASDE